MALSFSTALRNALGTAVIDRIDAGGAAATMEIYNGSRPATGGSATTLLASFTLNYPVAASPSGGVVTVSGTPIMTVAVATGTATWFRIKTSAGTFVMDGSVTATSGGGDVEIDDITIDLGDVVTLTSGTFTAPGP